MKLSLHEFFGRSPPLLVSKVLFVRSFGFPLASGSPVTAFQLAVEEFQPD